MKKFLNPGLFFCGVTYCFLCCVLCIIMILITDKSNDDYFSIVIIWVILAAAMVLSAVLCLPRWGAYIKICDNEIIFAQPFKKKNAVAISKYKYVYKAFYRHFGWKRYFIVLCQRPLSKYELMHINEQPPSVEVIKIRLSRKSLSYLRQRLPPKLKEKLKSI